MYNFKLKCCFTGHRPSQLPWKNKEEGTNFFLFKDNLRKTIISSIELGYTHFISGMAIGIDVICAEIILELKKIYPNLILECAIPCINQTAKWSLEDISRYKKILKSADKITLVSNTIYFNGCMKKRNKYMIDNCSRVIAIYNKKKSGGTYQTINMAKKQNKDIVIIELND